MISLNSLQNSHKIVFRSKSQALSSGALMPKPGFALVRVWADQDYRDSDPVNRDQSEYTYTVLIPESCTEEVCSLLAASGYEIF